MSQIEQFFTLDRLPARRRLLKAAVTVFASANLSRSASLAGTLSPRRKVVVGAHPWIYAAKRPNFDLTPVLPQVFADLAYAGADGIELMHTALQPADSVARIGELSRRHRLPVLGTSFGAAMWDRQQQATILELAGTVITRLAQLGGRTFGVSVGKAPGGRGYRKTGAQLDAQAECLLKTMAVCDRHGVVLNLHNHTYEIEHDGHDLKGTLERVPKIKLGPDLNWLVRGRVDPIDFIRRFGPQIVFLHLRDQDGSGRWPEAMGEGATDFAAIAAALREAGFAGDAVIELAHERDFVPTRPFRESIRMSREYVRRTMGY